MTIRDVINEVAKEVWWYGQSHNRSICLQVLAEVISHQHKTKVRTTSKRFGCGFVGSGSLMRQICIAYLIMTCMHYAIIVGWYLDTNTEGLCLTIRYIQCKHRRQFLQCLNELHDGVQQHLPCLDEERWQSVVFDGVWCHPLRSWLFCPLNIHSEPLLLNVVLCRMRPESLMVW